MKPAANANGQRAGLMIVPLFTTCNSGSVQINIVYILNANPSLTLILPLIFHAGAILATQPLYIRHAEGTHVLTLEPAETKALC